MKSNRERLELNQQVTDSMIIEALHTYYGDIHWAADALHYSYSGLLNRIRHSADLCEAVKEGKQMGIDFCGGALYRLVVQFYDIRATMFILSTSDRLEWRKWDYPLYSKYLWQPKPYERK